MEQCGGRELQFFTTSQDRINDLRWYSLMWEGHRDENRNRLSLRAACQTARLQQDPQGL